jgi:peptide/nickel transport system permease protein
MAKYIAGRILLIAPTLVAVILVIFFILNITPGDTATIILGPSATPEEIAILEHDLKLDRPFFVRFLSYLGDVLRLDFGRSYRNNLPVFDEIFAKFPITLKLALFSVLASMLIGIPVGVISAVRRFSFIDYSLTVAALFMASVPAFFLGLALILIFCLGLGVLPSSGLGAVTSYILPVVTLALPSSALLARMTRASMLETMRQDYIRTAKAKGAGKTRIIFKHALKPALLPVVVVLGSNFAAQLGGSVIVETVFGLPGLGSHILRAIRMKDTPVIMAVAILLAVIFKLVMLLVDVIQVNIDPRLRGRFVKREV